MTEPLPPLVADPCPPKTRADLEWDRLLGALSERCSCPLASNVARALPFAPSRDEARTWAREGAEALALLEAETPIPAAGIPDVGGALERIAEGGLLGAMDLRNAVLLLQAGKALRRFLEARGKACPALAAACTTAKNLDDVASEISGCFDPDGTLSDKASPRLRELRVEHRAMRARIQTKLDQFMSRNEHFIQERYVTEREGRWVIPVRATAVSRLSGTVLGESTSGSTVFFEPDVVAPLTTKLRGLEHDLEREEAAIYSRLSALLCGHADSVEACARAVGRADLRAATAKLARDLQLAFPRLTDEAAIDLREARHPLLVLDLGTAIASDVAIERGACLVISGPNAGGKTVTLKSMGIAVLMARAGLPIGAAPESSIGIFDLVLTELGDEQNLQKNLSTFSAHVKNVAGILERTCAGTLVLLDELASGTDPREGEALASGVLVSLCASGGVVAVTTHYDGLKALAIDDERFQNASVGFNFETLRPTFRLCLGVPGGSSAFVVAERFGIRANVISLARGFLSDDALRFEQVVRRMNEERASLERERQALAPSSVVEAPCAARA